MIALKNRKLYHLSQTVTRKCQQLHKMKINLSVKFFACFDNQTFNLRQIMNWPVTNKPYSIYSEDGKVKANTKFLFRNKLQSLCPVAPTNFAKYVSASVVDAMRVVRVIPIKGTNLPLYSTWAKTLFAHTEILPGNNIHSVFDNYNCENYNCEGDQFISWPKERLESSKERNVSSLNQVLPNANEWSEFFSIRKNKLQLCNLLADHFTKKSTICNKGKNLLH